MGSGGMVHPMWMCQREGLGGPLHVTCSPLCPPAPPGRPLADKVDHSELTTKSAIPAKT